MTGAGVLGRRAHSSRASVIAVVALAIITLGAVAAWPTLGSSRPPDAAPTPDETAAPARDPRKLRGFADDQASGGLAIYSVDVCRLLSPAEVGDEVRAEVTTTYPASGGRYSGGCEYRLADRVGQLQVQVGAPFVVAGPVAKDLTLREAATIGIASSRIVHPDECTETEGVRQPDPCQRLVRLPRLGTEAWAVTVADDVKAGDPEVRWLVSRLVFASHGLWVQVTGTQTTMDDPTTALLALARLVDARMPDHVTFVTNPCPPEGCS